MTDDIKDRVAKQPPFEKEEPKEEVKDEVLQSKTEEVITEAKVEGTKNVPEVTEDEALKNSKNPERTKEYIDKLKADKEEALKKAEAIKEEARKFATEGPVASLVKEQPKQEFDWNKMLVNTPPPVTQFPNLTPKQVKDTMGELVDDQGYVNTDLLRETLDKANAEAARARQEAQLARQEAQKARWDQDQFQRSAIAKQVHEKHPELNPDSEIFNPEYWDDVHNQVLRNYFEGKPEGFMEAAEKYADRYMKKEEKKEVKEQQDAVRQINATGTGKGSTRQPFGEHAALVEAVMKGKKGALAERLKRAGL